MKTILMEVGRDPEDDLAYKTQVPGPRRLIRNRFERVTNNTVIVDDEETVETVTDELVSAVPTSRTQPMTASTVTITTGSTASTVEDAPYTLTLAASGGNPKYVWDITAGTLPAGLTLNPKGVVSGTPTTPGESAVTFRATDSSIPALTQTKVITITITADE